MSRIVSVLFGLFIVLAGIGVNSGTCCMLKQTAARDAAASLSEHDCCHKQANEQASGDHCAGIADQTCHCHHQSVQVVEATTPEFHLPVAHVVAIVDAMLLLPEIQQTLALHIDAVVHAPPGVRRLYYRYEAILI